MITTGLCGSGQNSAYGRLWCPDYLFLREGKSTVRFPFSARSSPCVDSRRGARGFSADRGGAGSFALVFLIALVAGAAHLVRPGTDQLPLAGDGVKYHQLAEGIERLIQDPDLRTRLLRRELNPEEREELWIDRWEFQHAPAYTIPLGLLGALLPGDLDAGRTFSLLLYAAAAGFLFLLGRVMLGPFLAWIALLGYLLYLPFVLYGTAVSTESHASFALLLTAWVMWRFHRRVTVARALQVGLVLAFLLLAKTTFRVPAVAVLLGEVVFLLRGRRAHQLVTLLLGIAVPLALWQTFLVLADVPLNSLATSGQGSLWLYRGNYVPDQGWETCGLGDAITPELKVAGRDVARAAGRQLSADEQQRRMYPRAFWFTLRADPIGMLALMASKFGLFWTYPAIKTSIRAGIGTWALPRWIHLLLFPLGLLGVSLTLRRFPGLWFAGLLAIGVALVHAASHLVARYNVPVLPLWWLCALYSLGAIFRSLRRVIVPAGKRASRAGLIRLLAWPIAGLAGLLLAAILRHPPLVVSATAGRALYVAGALLAGLASFILLLFLAARLEAGRPRRRPRVWVLAIGPALLAAAVFGQQMSDPDWDCFAVTLRTPGDAVVQRITLPGDLSAAPTPFRSAGLAIDLLRAPRGSFVLEILVGGRVVHTLVDSLGTRYEDFLFDSKVHAVQGRYRRLADTCRAFVTGRLAEREERASIGFDYFRRWVSVEIPKAYLETDKVLEVELRLVRASGGAWVRLYADRYPPGGAERGFVGPAIGTNPYDHSSYRAEFFAADRERMDGRLIRPVGLQSSATVSLRRRGPMLTPDLGSAWGQQAGELRIRARGELVGFLAARRAPDGQLKPVWVTELAAGERLLSNDEVRDFASWRDQYFDGVWTF